MDPPIKITIQDFPDTPRTGDGLCQDCYEPFSPIRPPRRRAPRMSKLKISSKSCPGCRILFDFLLAAQRQASGPISVFSPVDLRRSWAYWVNEFSRSKENKIEDQATALEGLITFVQGLKKDEPLLGLWKEEIAEGLLWERGVWDEPARRKRITPFPSWSWMSLPGPVQYPSFPLTTKEIKLLDTRIRWSHQPLNSSLNRAELLIEAKVFKGTLTYHGRESPESSLYLEADGFPRVALYERVDIPDSYYDNMTIKLILIGSTVDHWFFLIAYVVNPERNPYVRIGRAYSPCNPKQNTFEKLKDIFATVQPQALTLR